MPGSWVKKEPRVNHRADGKKEFLLSKKCGRKECGRKEGKQGGMVSNFKGIFLFKM